VKQLVRLNRALPRTNCPHGAHGGHSDPRLTPKASWRIGCCQEKVLNRVPGLMLTCEVEDGFREKIELKSENSDFKESITTMSLINVSVINACSVLTDSDIQPVVDALQKQVDNDFGPAWGVDAS